MTLIFCILSAGIYSYFLQQGPALISGGFRKLFVSSKICSTKFCSYCEHIHILPQKFSPQWPQTNSAVIKPANGSRVHEGGRGRWSEQGGLLCFSCSQGQTSEIPSEGWTQLELHVLLEMTRIATRLSKVCRNGRIYLILT